MLVCVTVRVLFVWLVTGVAGKDVTRSHPILHTYRVYDHSHNTPEPYNSCIAPTLSFNNYTSCGEGYCRCQHEAADCSRHYGNLTYIPVLPLDISSLKFSLNRLTAIRNDDFFYNVTNILTLYLDENDLSYISAGAFRLLVNLRELRLGDNSLTYTALDPVLSVNTLTLLDLTSNALGTPPDGLFHNYSLPHLHTLCLFRVGMNSHLNMSIFKPLAQLNVLELTGDHLSQKSLFFDVLPPLNILMLTHNNFEFFPQTCTDFGSLMPNLTWLELSVNPLLALPVQNVCLPRLEAFTSLASGLLSIPTNAFRTQWYPLLTLVALSSGGLRGQSLTKIKKYAFNNTMLQIVALQYSWIDFSKTSIHPDCFAGCPNLSVLCLSGNDFSGVSEQKFQRLFNSSSLKELQLTSTNIGHINAEMFKNIPNLIILHLDFNKLTVIPDGAFDRLGCLEFLDLSSNQISVVRETTFSPATRQNLQHVYLGNNPFYCDCVLRWFRQWLDKYPDLFTCDKHILTYHPCAKYLCDSLVNTTVQSFYVADQSCLWSPAVSKFIIATVILLMLPLTAGAVIYRYRWHIRLVLYEAVRGRGDRWRRLQEQDFRYDVFVCYDSEDLDWVRAHLMPELEERIGLTLCIHSRDFTLGSPIVANIEESVETSKKIMMLFSKNFVHSHWCQFELQLCFTHVLEHGDTLLVVLLEEIPPSRDLTPAMMAVMKTLTYIEWEEDPEARVSFWGRIRLALHEILD